MFSWIPVVLIFIFGFVVIQSKRQAKNDEISEFFEELDELIAGYEFDESRRINLYSDFAKGSAKFAKSENISDEKMGASPDKRLLIDDNTGRFVICDGLLKEYAVIDVSDIESCKVYDSHKVLLDMSKSPDKLADACYLNTVGKSNRLHIVINLKDNDGQYIFDISNIPLKRKTRYFKRAIVFSWQVFVAINNLMIAYSKGELKTL